MALLLVTFLHLVIGEMVPKNLAIAGPEPVLLALALPNRIFMLVFGPVIRALNGVANRAVRLIGLEPKEELASAHTPEELAAVLAQSRREGTIEGSQADLLSGALDLAERPGAGRHGAPRPDRGGDAAHADGRGRAPRQRARALPHPRDRARSR